MYLSGPSIERRAKTCHPTNHLRTQSASCNTRSPKCLPLFSRTEDCPIAWFHTLTVSRIQILSIWMQHPSYSKMGTSGSRAWALTSPTSQMEIQRLPSHSKRCEMASPQVRHLLLLGVYLAMIPFLRVEGRHSVEARLQDDMGLPG